jgi:hypothetical protein
VETNACNFQHPPGSGRLRSFIASASVRVLSLVMGLVAGPVRGDRDT